MAKWEYRVTSLAPTGKGSPMADSEDWQTWLDRYDQEGWEFVGQIQRWWNDRAIPQQFYVFRRERT